MAGKRVNSSRQTLDFHRPGATIPVLKTAQSHITAVWLPGAGTSLVEMKRAAFSVKCGDDHA